MQFTCYYIHRNRAPAYVAFCKHNNLVRIYLDNQYQSVVITYDTLIKINSLYQYYLCSLVLTDPSYTIQYNPKGTWISSINVWCISSKCDWKRMHYTNNSDYYVGWIKDPRRNPPLTISSKSKTKRFLERWALFVDSNDYYNDHYYRYIPDDLCLLDEMWYKLVGCNIDEIEQELNEVQKCISEMQNDIKSFALIYSHTSIPIHVIEMIMTLVYI